MKRFPYFIMAVWILALACGAPGFSATATPEATLTVVPSKTPTTVPTPTRDATATKAAQSTQTAKDIFRELDALLSDTEIPYKGGHLLWQKTEPLTIDMSGPSEKFLAVDKKLVVDNFILKSDVTWTATGILLCGIIFRSEPNIEDGRQYQLVFLRFSGLPAWGIEFHEFGGFKSSTTGTQYSGAIEQGNGATNHFVLVAQDGEFSVYINDVRQGRYFDNSVQRAEGALALLGYQDSGKGSCKFENTSVWALE